MVGCGGRTATVAAVPFIADEDGIGGRRSGVHGAGVRWMSGVALLCYATSLLPRYSLSMLVVGRQRRVRLSARMVSILGFVTWTPVHPIVGISTTVTWFNF